MDRPGLADPGEAWVPGGRAMVYAAAHGGPPNLFYKDLATGADRQLLSDPRYHFPNDVTADGRIIYQQRTELGTWDLMAVSLGNPGQPAPLFASDFSEFGARLAPGDVHLAFVSDESRREEVYLSPFPVTGAKTPVTTAGGVLPRWRRDGRELYFISADRKLMASTMDASGQPGPPRVLFDVNGWLDYDVARDGRFVAVVSQARGAEGPLAVIINWARPGAR